MELVSPLKVAILHCTVAAYNHPDSTKKCWKLVFDAIVYLLNPSVPVRTNDPLINQSMEILFTSHINVERNPKHVVTLLGCLTIADNAVIT